MVILAILAEVDFTWPKSGELGGSSRPTAPTESTWIRPSRWDRLGRFLDRRCWRKISHPGRDGASMARTVGRWGSVEAALQARAGESEIPRTAWI